MTQGLKIREIIFRYANTFNGSVEFQIT